MAQALTTALGEPWTRQMVGNLEAGRKVLEVEILMMIAEIHDLPFSFYLESPGTYAKGVSRNSILATAAA